jgi:broad specificity phosphatase PhoE
MRNRTVIWKAAAALAALLVTITIGACSGTPHVPTITLTFIRHAESQANADGVINTDVPGPSLTEEGQAQAEQLAHQLSRNNFDDIYASDMIRTQQTAEPLAHALGKPVQNLSGLNEIDAGWYNNTRTRPPMDCLTHPPTGADGKTTGADGKAKFPSCTYLLAPADWLNGDVSDAIPGSISGVEFNNNFTKAVQKIYDDAKRSGKAKPVAFSHGESIAYWTLMNVKNPKNSLAYTHPLPNVGRVVVTGNPAMGWTLVDWDGIRDFS